MFLHIAACIRASCIQYSFSKHPMNPAGHKPKPNNFIEQRAAFREVIANVSGGTQKLLLRWTTWRNVTRKIIFECKYLRGDIRYHIMWNVIKYNSIATVISTQYCMMWNNVESEGARERENRSTTHHIKLNLCILLTTHSNLWNLPLTDYRSKRLRCLHRIPSVTLLILSQSLLLCKWTIISQSSEATNNINLMIYLQKAMSPLWKCHPKRNRSSSNFSGTDRFSNI